jgi:hypothetical protein
MTANAEDITEAFDRLKRAGWSIGEAARLSRDGGLVWLVSGRNGENVIRAEGASQAAAWREAVGQARAVGMIGGCRPGEPGAG